MSEQLSSKSIVTAWSGREINLWQPDPSSIQIRDIVYALSNIARFNGHLSKRITVAQHSLAVFRIVSGRHKASAKLSMCALMHDAHEAYIGDISTPVKMQLGDQYRSLERRVQLAILDACCPKIKSLGFPEEVKEADRLALHYEASTWLRTTWAQPVELLVYESAPYRMNRQQAVDAFIATWARTLNAIKQEGEK